ncbi:hypothetical protein PpBr36_00446 [Pyricularia pennisetigena]|uniref:hypothetical protein n=1 Tax=Pyricularia pennisetigena TaxID=1578925 RepID=UPI001153DAB3|nr:hypothetical protein PpBr36_00446 [Pyricularia pennisetigena]TLS28662.1 hypothetical protein PpBr36_00446 [Pyricularia pennisetigena]
MFGAAPHDSSRGAKDHSPGSWMGVKSIGRGVKITAKTAKRTVPRQEVLMPRRKVGVGTVGRGIVYLHATRYVKKASAQASFCSTNGLGGSW